MLEAAKKKKVMHSPHSPLSNHTFAGHRQAGRKKRCDRIPIIQIQSDTKIVILNNQIL